MSLTRCQARSSNQSIRRGTRTVVESLERRSMLSVNPGHTFETALNVGELSGTQSFADAIQFNSESADIYKFSLTHNAQFFGRLRTDTGLALIELFQEQTDSHGNVNENLLEITEANQSGPDGGFSSGDAAPESLKPGTYYAYIVPLGVSTTYSMRITSDYGGNSLASARDLGTATDTTVPDFIGTSTTPSLNDPVDYFKVKMAATGQLTASVQLDNQDPSLTANVALIHDVNGNGKVDSGDVLLHTTSANFTRAGLRVNAGTYFIQVQSNTGSSNYHLRVNADYAGTIAGFVRPMGSIDSVQSFNDYISKSDDLMDDYSFNVSGSRPLLLIASENGGGNLFLSLYKDANNNGVADTAELVTSTPASNFASLLTDISAGKYIVRVQAFSGSGTYTLSAEAKPDAAGNSLKSAHNIGTLSGLTHLEDFVSDADPVDYYKFTTPASGSIGAALAIDFGGDADIALIHDANNNGVVDKNDVLASATATKMGEEFTKPIPAGTYYLRVSYVESQEMTAMYFLSMQGDYAGNTPSAARNIGTLSGSHTFDDWASGPFGGAISDTADFYKFKLSSSKSFSAKLIGDTDGQDLDLLLYQDKNNDGKLTSNELIASSKHANSPNEQFSKSISSGTYYVKVVGVNGETNYHLTLKA